MRDNFQNQFHVSRETIRALDHYQALIEKWNPKINLISKHGASDIWLRHFADSAQILKLFPKDAITFVDIGSGGGFPGVVLAILLSETRPQMIIELIESDKRKCAFLMTVASALNLQMNVTSERIEDIPNRSADVITARALAPLPALLGYVSHHLAPCGTALLAKGREHVSEIRAADVNWSFDLVTHKSITDPAAAILEVSALKKKPIHVS